MKANNVTVICIEAYIYTKRTLDKGSFASSKKEIWNIILTWHPSYDKLLK